jgi:periplasmic divalent cation tolerance protein
VERADEWLLVIKTARHLLDEVIARVQALHSYSVPEVLALPVLGGSPAYLAWFVDQLRPAAGPEEPSRD